MATETSSWVGQTLAGRYRVSSLLGQGGMGLVYRARDAKLGADVVIKVPRRALLEETGFAGRFAREIRSLVQLSHPHIVKVWDVDQHDGLPFAVLQYLPGGSLRDRQKRGPDGRPTPMAPGDLSGWVGKVAAALDFVHQRKYVHRDVKPDNILFDAHNNPFLSDFGVTKVLADRPGQKDTVMTGAGMILGTPQYMAPELIMGQPFDGRADQYAFGVMVYELLSGRYPFAGGTSTAVLVQHTTQEPPPLESVCPGVPPGVALAVRRAMAKDPGRRFPDCSSFARAVLAGLAAGANAGTAITAAKVSTAASQANAEAFRFGAPAPAPASRARKVARGKPAWLVPVGLGAAVFVLGGGVAAFLASGPKKDRKNLAANAARDMAAAGPTSAAVAPSAVARSDESKPNPEAAKGAEPPVAEAPKPVAKPEGEVRRFKGHTGAIWCVDISPDGRYALSGSAGEATTGKYNWQSKNNDDTVRAWDLRAGTPVWFRKHADGVKYVCFSPDGRRAASGSWDKTVRVWEVETAQEICHFSGHTDKITGVAFFPDGSRAASVGLDGTLRTWDTASGKEGKGCEPGVGSLYCVAVSADGRHVYCGARDLVLDIEPATGTAARRFEGQSDIVHSVSVSPDGRLLAAGNAPGAGVVWEADTGRLRHRFTGHAVRFTADSRWLVTGCADGSVRVVDPRNGPEMHRFSGHANFVQGVAVTADSRFVLSGSWDGTVRLWRLPDAFAALGGTTPPPKVEPVVPQPKSPSPPPAPVARKVDPVLLKLKPGGLAGRRKGTREALLRLGGGTDESEKAVARGLAWLARHQRKDGAWVFAGYDRGMGEDGGQKVAAATAMALLPFLAAGESPRSPGGVYHQAVVRGFNALVRMQGPDGATVGETAGYNHGLVTIALCEAFALSGDARLKTAAQKAIRFAELAQAPAGGWQYAPRTGSDTSASGWVHSGLHAGQGAGLTVSQQVLKRFEGFLDGVNGPDGGYGYGKPGSTPTCTAVGLLCRMHLGWNPDRPEIQRGLALLTGRSPETSASVYHLYYASQVLHHVGGPAWEEWNGKVLKYLLSRQAADGSWSPVGDAYAQQGGRLMTTALSVLTLQVYYRYVPYWFRNV